MGSNAFLRGCSTRAAARVTMAVATAVLAACSATPNNPSNNSGGASVGATGGVPAGGSPVAVAGNMAQGGAGASSGGASAGDTSTSGGTGPTFGGGPAMAGSVNGGSTAGGAPSSAGSTAVGTAGTSSCQMANYQFAPKTPTVYVLVDRSGSMFDCLSTDGNIEPRCPTPDDTSWVRLREAVLTVIEQLQADVRVGFAAFTGTNPASNGTCPMIDQVAPDLNNHMPIQTLYRSLEFQPETTEQGKKFETPARQALDMIGEDLLADPTPGGKYILFVTDGQPDYCDDANTLCAPDSVVAGLQGLYAKGITTIVMGLKSKLNDLAPGILQSFANAGAGEDTLPPLKANTDIFAFYDQCQSIDGWAADLVTSGKPAERGVTLGTYAEVSGPTKPFEPSAADQAMLATQIGQAFAAVKECKFDLGNVNGQSIKVDLNTLADATVKIEGTAVPFDMANGWSMASETQLVLNGAACDTWRTPDTNDISFDFPCKTIIFE